MIYSEMNQKERNQHRVCNFAKIVFAVRSLVEVNQAIFAWLFRWLNSHTLTVLGRLGNVELLHPQWEGVVVLEGADVVVKDPRPPWSWWCWALSFLLWTNDLCRRDCYYGGNSAAVCLDQRLAAAEYTCTENIWLGSTWSLAGKVDMLYLYTHSVGWWPGEWVDGT